MKKLILLASAALICCFTSCNSGTDAEPSTTVFANVSHSQATEAQPVTVTADLSNDAGLYNAWIAYFINDDQEHPTTGAPTSYHGALSGTFTATIPAQAADAKVTFQLVAFNMQNSLTVSQIFTYTVQAAPKNE